MILDSSYHGIYHIILPLKCCQSSTKRSSWRTGLGLFTPRIHFSKLLLSLLVFHLSVYWRLCYSLVGGTKTWGEEMMCNCEMRKECNISMCKPLWLVWRGAFQTDYIFISTYIFLDDEWEQERHGIIYIKEREENNSKVLALFRYLI